MDTVKQQRIDLGKRIKAKRLENKMTLQELADKMGYINRSSISKLENGENGIPQDKINQLAEALNASVAYLMGWEDHFVMPPYEPDHFVVEPVDDKTLDEIRASLIYDYTAIKLLRQYRSLTFEGQRKIEQYVEDLVATGLYTRNTDSKVG